MRTFLLFLSLVVVINVLFITNKLNRPLSDQEISTAEQNENKEQASNFPKKALAKSVSQTATLNLHTEPPSLDPRQVEDHLSEILIKALFDGLTRMNQSGEIELSLAENIQHAQDYRTYIIRLKKSAWSNGDSVTAHDFAYAWKKILDPQFSGIRPEPLYVIKNARAARLGNKSLDDVGIYVPNERTLVIALEHPCPHFLELISNAAFMPVCSRVDRENPKWMLGSKDFVCNGPFKIKSWKQNFEIILQKNEKYWDQEAVSLEEIRWLIIKDQQTELNLFKKGELDWAGHPFSSLNPDALPSLKAQGLVHQKPLAATYTFLFNTETVPFNSKKMRKAFSYAINRQAIVEHLTMGSQLPATRLFPPCLSCKTHNYFVDHDIQEARNLFNKALAEMGMHLSDLPKITLSYNGLDINEHIAQTIQQNWQEAFGIEVQLQRYEWRVHLSHLRQRLYQIGRYGLIAKITDPMDMLEPFAFFEKDQGLSPWRHIGFQQAVTKAQQTVDPLERKKYMLEAERILMQEMPIAPVYHYVMNYVKSKRLKGVALSSRGVADFKWAYIE